MVCSGIDFGTGQWSTNTTNWNGFGSKFAGFTTNVSSRSFTIPSGKVLKSIKISGDNIGGGLSYIVSDGVNTNKTGTVPMQSPVTLTTGWTTAASIITLAFGSGWDVGIDDIVYGSP